MAYCHRKTGLDSAGRVDVSLERAERKVACEVSVASTVEQELANIQKCLAAGYEQVVVLAKDRRFLGKLGDAVRSELEEDSKVRVLFLEPEELVAWLEEEDAAAAGEVKTVRGYRVKVRYTPLAEKDKDTKKQAISRVVLDSLKRLRKDSE